MRRGIWPIMSAGMLLTLLAVLAAFQKPPETAPSATPPPGPGTPPKLDEPLDLVPAEALLCWYGRPLPDTRTPSGEPSPMSTLLQLVLPDAKSKLYARILEAFVATISYPHALALIDAQARPLDSNPSARRVDRLRFAAIIRLGDQDEHFVRIIQAAVNEQTDTAQATLARRQAGAWYYQELRDRRLPDWATLAWGRIGPYFVVTVGPEVWPGVAAVAEGQAAGLGGSEFVQQVRGPRARAALIEITVAARNIRERLDPFVDGRATDFFQAWDCGNLERAHWALGFEGSALYCVANSLEDGQVRQRIFADPGIREPRLLATIPDTARYAIYHVSPAEVLPRLCTSLLATQGREYRRRVEEFWERIQAQYGFDVRRDLLAHLGEYIVMHNDPPHPLHIPLAMTTLTEIRGEPARVRRTVDALCEAWRTEQRRRTEEGERPGGFSLERDAQGIWYIQYPFFAGPAWTVTDRFLITSWSPMALRAYLDKIGERAGRVSAAR